MIKFLLVASTQAELCILQFIELNVQIRPVFIVVVNVLASLNLNKKPRNLMKNFTVYQWHSKTNVDGPHNSE